MISPVRTLTVLWSLVLLLAVPLYLKAGSNEYQCIVERNIFALRTNSPPPPSTQAVAELPKITLTGITTIFGDKRALIKVNIPDKFPEPAKEQSYILREGQASDGIEVLEVQIEPPMVKIDNHGTVQELTFEKEGVEPDNLFVHHGPPTGYPFGP